MDVPLKHVIGTVSLIGLVIAAGLAYTIITSYIEADIIKKQLSQIAENVASNLVEVISLVNFANFMNNETMMKILDLPSDLGGKAYLISLVIVNETGQAQYYVLTQLTTRHDTSARSSIPLNANQTQLVLITNSTGILRVRGEEKRIIQYSDTVFGGTQEIRDQNGQIVDRRFVAVWGWKMSIDTTWAGIGIWKLGGS